MQDCGLTKFLPGFMVAIIERAQASGACRSSTQVCKSGFILLQMGAEGELEGGVGPNFCQVDQLMYTKQVFLIKEQILIMCISSE